MKYKNKNLTKIFFLLCTIIFTTQKIQAQQGVGINTTTPHPSAVLDITSADKGILIPRISTTARIGIISPAKGLMVYDSTVKSFYFYDGLAWTNVGNSQLEKITENGKIGYRILGRDTANVGNIGNAAIDLSKQTIANNTTGATGDNSLAIGLNTTASGTQAMAMGDGSIAYGPNAVAIGQQTIAYNNFSLAMGYRTGASGTGSVASGFQSLATGDFSNASGFNTISPGLASAAFGNNSISLGYASVSMGDSTKAQSYAEVAIGSNNTRYTAASIFDNNIADRAFVVGIGNGLPGNINEKNDGLIVYKNGTIELDTLTTAPAITNNRLFVQNKKLRYNGLILNTSELEKITENSKTGYRILGNNAANYGNIGNYAIDFSNQSTASNTTGSTGDYSINAGYNTTASGINSTASGNGTIASGYLSTSMGLNTIAIGNISTSMGSGTRALGELSTSMGFETNALGSYSTAVGNNTKAYSWSEIAVGSFNTDYYTGDPFDFSVSDRAFVVGIGHDAGTKNDGLTVYKDGTLEIDMLPTLPTNVSAKLYAYNNKLHYNGALLNTSQLEKITQNGNTGYRILGANATNYAKIGNSAIDLSYQTAPSTMTDSIGNYAFNVGYNTKASGLNATAFGNTAIASGYATIATGVRTNAIGDASSALGFETSALGTRSTATGSNTTAQSWSEMAVGGFNTDYTALSAYNFNTADRAFVVGIGNGIAGNSGEKNDGFIVHKNGTVELDVLAAAPTTTANRLYNVGNTLYINGVVVGAQTSDVRFKEKIENLPSTLAAIKKLRPVSFYWKNNKWGSQKEIGFIAQELKEQFPEVVSTDADGFYKVNYGILTSVLTKAVQEQQTEMDSLKKIIEALKKDSEELKALMKKVIGNK